MIKSTLPTVLAWCSQKPESFVNIHPYSSNRAWLSQLNVLSVKIPQMMIPFWVWKILLIQLAVA